MNTTDNRVYHIVEENVAMNEWIKVHNRITQRMNRDLWIDSLGYLLDWETYNREFGGWR